MDHKPVTILEGCQLSPLIDTAIKTAIQVCNISSKVVYMR